MKKKLSLFPLFLLFTLCVSLAQNSVNLLTFRNYALNSSDNHCVASVLQGDSIVMVGHTKNISTSDYEFSAIRVKSSTLAYDNTFGSSGKVLIPIGSVNSGANCVAIQSDNKIVIAGYTTSYTTNGPYNDIAVVRLNVNGSLDSTFNGGGIYTYSISQRDDEVTSVVLQADGKILLCGYSRFFSGAKLMVLRLNTNGTLDNTFNGIGFLSYSFFPGKDCSSKSMQLQTDGKIVVSCAFLDANNNSCIGIIRLNTDGTFDNTFNASGNTYTIMDWSASVSSLKIQNDGKIILLGSINSSFGPILNSDLFLIRYTSSGVLDTSFNLTGILIEDVNNYGDDRANDFEIQPDGKYIVTGVYSTQSSGSSYHISVLRFNANGIRDLSFNSVGYVIGNGGVAAYDDYDPNILLMPGGYFFISGTHTTYLNPQSSYAFFLLKYLEVLPLEMAENKIKSSLRVSPNPFTSQTTINLNKEYKNVTVRIINALGAEVRNITFTGNQFILERDDLKAGMYFIQIISENETIGTNKIIIN